MERRLPVKSINEYKRPSCLFNELPAEAGTYHCIQICFYPASGRIAADEYTANLS